MAGTDEQFSFIDDEQDTAPPDATGERGQRAPPWKVLSVEDDRGYQASLTYGLRGLTVLGRPVELLSANSATEAAVLLANQTDIGLILLDVVMEEEDAGLRLVETIRNTLGNQTVRIVLLTGQPGVAPRARVIQEYDINEYWNKSELQDRLPSIVTTNLRTWQTMAELEQAHVGLQMVVEASQHLADRYDLQHFSDTVLQQIAQVIGLGETGGEGILCLEHNPRQAGGVRVLSSFGAFRHSHRQSPDELSGTLATFAPAIDEALRSRRHQFQDNYVVLYFPQNALLHEPGDEIVHTVLLKTPGPLSESTIRLLSVFSENIKTGFTNLMLVDRLRALSYFDASLDIYNRNWLIRELRRLSRRQWQAGTLLLFSLNDYAERTLTFGHAAVEQFMTKLYRHLNTRLPPGTPFVRIGLDTLGVLSPSDRLPDDGALRGLSLVDIPLEGATRKVRLTLARLNLADVERECPAEEVLHLAQTVLYTAKREKQPLGVYRPEVLTRIQNDFDLLQQLIQALEEDRLTIFLQPKIRLNNRQVVGFEALVRWPQEDGSFIAPGAFLPLAETSGLLNALDLQILRKTVAATQYLSSLGHALPISFNATWSDLCNPDYVGKLLSILDSGQVDPARLEIEITETQAMQGYHEVAPLLATLRERGMAVSIDDFGTGHSSLAYLATLPADTIKIDRSFVQELGSGSIGEHVTEIVIALGRRFGYTVVAEGIETEAQRAHLVNMGCAIGQGFLFARPMSVDDVVDWLAQT